MNRPAESCSAEQLYTTPITSQLPDRLEYQVTDEAVAANRNSSRYQALCGQLFVAAPLAAPAGRSCPDCAAHQPRHRRLDLRRRLHRARPGVDTR